MRERATPPPDDRRAADEHATRSLAGSNKKFWPPFAAWAGKALRQGTRSKPEIFFNRVPVLKEEHSNSGVDSDDEGVRPPRSSAPGDDDSRGTVDRFASLSDALASLADAVAAGQC